MAESPNYLGIAAFITVVAVGVAAFLLHRWQESDRIEEYSATPMDSKTRFKRKDKTIKISKKNPLNDNEISIFSDKIIPQPPKDVRKWKIINNDLNDTRGNNLHLRIVQYNILADIYASPERYTSCPMENLNWEYRKKNIVHEILQQSPDIITLQEVDDFEGLDKLLHPFGYSGIYRQRTSQKDGLAIFYKNNIELLDAHSINYNILQNETKSTKWVEQLRYNRNNVGLFSLFKIKGTEQIFTVATTHIYWDPKFSDVKIRQSHMLLKELTEYLQEKATLETPFVITGDFNSLPKSAVYELYSKRTISGTHPEFLKWPAKENLTHNLNLKSVYAIINEPDTNITPGFNGCIDYIWCDSSFKVNSLLEMIPREFIEKENTGKFVGLPTISFSSDHVLLACELQFVRKSISANESQMTN